MHFASVILLDTWTTSGSELVIADYTAKWTIGSTKLFDNVFAHDPVNARITWQNVDQISTARVQPPVPITIDGNIISYPQGAAIEWVTGYAHPRPMRCDGPASCLVNLQGTRTFESSP